MEALTRPWLNLQKKLEKFLDEDSPSQEEEKLVQQNFTLLTTPTYLRGLSEGLPEDELDRVAVIFSRLMHVFEYGLLLSGDKTSFQSVAFFDRGVLKNIKSGKLFSLNLKSVPFGSFVSPKAENFLSQIRHFFPTIKKEDEILLIRLSPQTVLVIASSLANPWLNLHLENVQKFLSEALSS